MSKTISLADIARKLKMSPKKARRIARTRAYDALVPKLLDSDKWEFSAKHARFIEKTLTA